MRPSLDRNATDEAVSAIDLRWRPIHRSSPTRIEDLRQEQHPRSFCVHLEFEPIGFIAKPSHSIGSIGLRFERTLQRLIDNTDPFEIKTGIEYMPEWC